MDCGKTFVENARRFFPRWGVRTIDAVLLTHGREYNPTIIQLQFKVGTISCRAGDVAVKLGCCATAHFAGLLTLCQMPMHTLAWTISASGVSDLDATYPYT